MENIINGLNLLEKLTRENETVTIKNSIADLFKEMGYSAIADEIRNNRKAKSNALHGLRMFYSGVASDRINPKTKEVFPVGENLKKKAAKFKAKLESIVNEYLTDGSDKQLKYLELKRKYDNEYYKLGMLSGRMEMIEIRENRTEWDKLHQEYKDQLIAANKARNKLDAFVFENIN